MKCYSDPGNRVYIPDIPPILSFTSFFSSTIIVRPLTVLLLYYTRAVRGRPVSLRVFLKSSLFVSFGLHWHRASSGTEERQIDQFSPLYILCTVYGVALICASKQMRTLQNLHRRER